MKRARRVLLKVVYVFPAFVILQKERQIALNISKRLLDYPNNLPVASARET